MCRFLFRSMYLSYARRGGEKKEGETGTSSVSASLLLPQSRCLLTDRLNDQ